MRPSLTWMLNLHMNDYPTREEILANSIRGGQIMTTADEAKKWMEKYESELMAEKFIEYRELFDIIPNPPPGVIKSVLDYGSEGKRVPWKEWNRGIEEVKLVDLLWGLDAAKYEEEKYYDLCKCDIEGSELRCLQNPKNTIHRCHWLILEMHSIVYAETRKMLKNYKHWAHIGPIHLLEKKYETAV